MKRIGAISLTVSIAVIALFGAIAMQHTNEHGHIGCLAAAAPVEACPTTDIVAMFLFHAKILKSILLAVTSGYAAFASLPFLFIIALDLIRERAGLLPALPHSTSLFFFEKFFLSIAPLMRWLALHENSPSFS